MDDIENLSNELVIFRRALKKACYDLEQHIFPNITHKKMRNYFNYYVKKTRESFNKKRGGPIET